MIRRRVLRVFLFASAALSLLFAVSTWLNIDSDLSAENFAGEALNLARYIWIEVNLMLGALAVTVVALLVALRQQW